MSALSPVQLFKCLGDETRLALTLLIHTEGELCVCDLADLFEITQPAVSRHLKILREKAIVTIKMYAIMAAAPVACVLVSIGCYIWFGGTLTVVKLLTTLMLIVK